MPENAPERDLTQSEQNPIPDCKLRPYHALKAIPDIEERILEGIRQGKSMLTLAKQYGVSDNAIWKRVKSHPDYRDILETGMELRMDKREQELENAVTNVDVTRADRLLAHGRWLAGVVSPQRFGQRTAVTGADGGPLTIQVVRFGSTIDGETVSDVQQIPSK